MTSMRFGCTALVALAAAKDWDPSAMVKHIAEREHVSLVEAEARTEKAGALSPKEGRFLRLQERKEMMAKLRKDMEDDP